MCKELQRQVQVHGINHPRNLYTWVAGNHRSLICSSACNWVGVKWVHILCWQEVGELLIKFSQRWWVQQQCAIGCIYRSRIEILDEVIEGLCVNVHKVKWAMDRHAKIFGGSWSEVTNWASSATRNHHNGRARDWRTNLSTCIIHNYGVKKHSRLSVHIEWEKDESVMWRRWRNYWCKEVKVLVTSTSILSSDDEIQDPHMCIQGDVGGESMCDGLWRQLIPNLPSGHALAQERAILAELGIEEAAYLHAVCINW